MIALAVMLLVGCSDPSGSEPDSALPDAGPLEEDAGDDACEATAYYRDQDGDGWGAGDPLRSCGPMPAGYSYRDNDCNDTDGRIYPGQTAFLVTAPFDANCDGEEELERVSVYKCPPAGTGTADSCRLPPAEAGMHWDDRVPACGEEGEILVRCEWQADPPVCIREAGPATQACR